MSDTPAPKDGRRQSSGQPAGRGPGRGDEKVTGNNPGFKWGSRPLPHGPRPGHPRPGTTDGDRNR